MCGRYGMSVSQPRLSEAFPHVEFPLAIAPRYNIAPTQDVLALRQVGPRIRAELLRWGLAAPGRGERTLINVRSETVAESGRHRGLLRHGRVVLPATHFYEWRGRDPKGTPPNSRHSQISHAVFCLVKKKQNPH